MGAAIFIGLALFGGIVGSCADSKKKVEEARQAAEARSAAQERKAAEQARLSKLSPEERAAEEKRLAEEAAKQKQVREAEAKQAEQSMLRTQGLIWNYQDYNDELTGKRVQTAFLKSVNQVTFDFPYQGAQRGTLALRKHPKHGNDAYLQIEKGQFVCGIEDCMVSVRFDDGPVQQFGVVGPADQSTEILFFSNYSRFVQRLQKAKRVYISAVVYQEGSPTFEFNVEGLDWE